MKINLAAKNNNVKDNYPPRYLNVCFKRIKNETQKQKKRINHNSAIAKDDQCVFKPG